MQLGALAEKFGRAVVGDALASSAPLVLGAGGAARGFRAVGVAGCECSGFVGAGNAQLRSRLAAVGAESVRVVLLRHTALGVLVAALVDGPDAFGVALIGVVALAIPAERFASFRRGDSVAPTGARMRRGRSRVSASGIHVSGNVTRVSSNVTRVSSNVTRVSTKATRVAANATLVPVVSRVHAFAECRHLAARTQQIGRERDESWALSHSAPQWFLE